MAHQRGHREPGDLEVGAADMFIPHEKPHTAPRAPPPAFLTKWETHRPKWAMEMLAETLGVFLYCWAGMGATVAFFVGAAEKEEGFGSILTVAMCYGAGIMLAIILAGPTSGSHLNPCFTIAFAIFKGFPWRKVPQYIAAQIFGGLLAGLIVYAQNYTALHAITEKIIASGAPPSAIFSPQGPAGTIGLYLLPTAQIGIVFVNEIVCSAILALAVFVILDPSNVFIAPTTGPVLIGLAYFVAVANFAGNGIALNTARDVGARFASAIIWGRKGAFPAQYSALAALTNIAGTLVGASIQTFFLSDTVRPPTQAALAAHHATEHANEAHLQRVITAKENGGYTSGSGMSRIFSSRTDQKLSPHVEHKELQTPSPV